MEDLIERLKEAKDMIMRGDSHAIDKLNEAVNIADSIKEEIEAIMTNKTMSAGEFIGLPDGKIINFNGTVEKLFFYLDGQKMNPPSSIFDPEKLA